MKKKFSLIRTTNEYEQMFINELNQYKIGVEIY